MLTSGHRADAARLVNEAASLRSAGWIVSIVCPCVETGQSLPYAEAVQVRGARTAWGRLRRLLGLIKSGLKQDADVYHAHELDSLAIALLLAKLRRARAVYDCHEYHAEAITEKRIRRVRLRRVITSLIGRIERFMVRRCALIIVVNDHLAVAFVSEKSPVITLPNYPLLSLMSDASPPAKLAARYADKDVVIYVGKFAPERGIDLLIEAVGRLTTDYPDLRLLLVGRPTSARYGTELNRLIDSLGLHDTVEITGQVPHSDVAPYLSIAHIGAFLLQPVSERYNHGEPIKMFEYAAAGLPVVVSDLPAKHSLVERMQNGILVNPLSLDEIVEAFSTLIQDSGLRKQLGEQGFNAFRTTYNWEQVEGRLTTAYKEIHKWEPRRGS